MALVWLYKIVLWFVLVSRCVVFSESERLQNADFTTPTSERYEDTEVDYEGRFLGQTCTSTIQCMTTTDNSYCSPLGFCQCQHPYQNVGMSCYFTNSARYLDQTCTVTSQCNATTENSYCSPSGFCECQYPYQSMGMNCYNTISGIELGKKCKILLECMKRTANSHCTVSGICECEYPYQKIGSYCENSVSGRSLGESCMSSSQCTAYTSSSFCSSRGICECMYPYKRSGYLCSTSTKSRDSDFPWVGVVAVIIITVLFVGTLSSWYAKRRSERRSPRGVVVSNQTSVRIPEMRDDPPTYGDLTPRVLQHTVVETPPPGYDQWQKAQPFHFPVSSANVPTVHSGVTNHNTTVLPNISVSVEQGQTNAAFDGDRST